MIQFRRPAVFGTAAVLAGITSFAVAQVDEPRVSGAGATHIAILSGDNEVPPVTTNGNGTAFLLLDVQTNTLTWTIEYTDLTGPVTGVHIHGPATAEENADVIIDLGAEGLESPIEGQTTLTLEEAQIDQLTAGEWYVNVHTEANPDGEIRGQIVAAGAEGAAAGPAATRQTAAGLVYVGPNGMTLYTFDNDTAGVTNCYGGCATAWPPFFAEAGAVAAGEWTIVPRTDGTQMWAYEGKPMYYFANDANPGDVNGNQPTGQWHVVIVD